MLNARCGRITESTVSAAFRAQRIHIILSGSVEDGYLYINNSHVLALFPSVSDSCMEIRKLHKADILQKLQIKRVLTTSYRFATALDI